MLPCARQACIVDNRPAKGPFHFVYCTMLSLLHVSGDRSSEEAVHVSGCSPLLPPLGHAQACDHPFLVLGKGPAAAEMQQPTLKISANGGASGGVGNADEGESTEALGSSRGDAGKAPGYVRELYRRYRERVAANERDARDTAVGGKLEDGRHQGVDGGDAAGYAGSRAFVDSVVGQLRVRANHKHFTVNLLNVSSSLELLWFTRETQAQLK